MSNQTNQPMVAPSDSPNGSGSLSKQPMRRFGHCSPSQASEAALILLGLYPKGSAENPDIYATGIATVLASYPPDVVRQVCSPFGIASRVKWLPTVYEVKEACEIAMGPYYADAAEKQKRGEERLAEMANKAKYGPDPLTPEQMAANVERVDRLLAQFKKTSPPPEFRKQITGDMTKEAAEIKLACVEKVGPEFSDDLRRLIDRCIDASGAR